MDISSLLLVLPQTPSWESSAPLAVVNNIHPGDWAIKDSPLCISHSLQGNNQNLGAYRGADSHEPNHQPHSGWIIYLWLARAESHIATTLVFPNDSGFWKVLSDHGCMTNNILLQWGQHNHFLSFVGLPLMWKHSGWGQGFGHNLCAAIWHQMKIIPWDKVIADLKHEMEHVDFFKYLT